MPLTKQQQHDRAKGIGASESYIACGFSAFQRTPVSLWAQKTGRKQRDEIPEENMERVEIGNEIEGLIANRYAERVGKPVRVSRKNYTHKDPSLSFMRCYVDRLVEKSDVILECKNVDSFQFDRGDWGEPGTDQVPLNYLFQCQHMLAVTRRERCDVAALVGGNTLKIYRIDADAEFQTMIERSERAFWDYVESDKPPEIMTAQDISQLYPCEDGELPPKIASIHIRQMLEQYKFNRTKKKKHADAQDELGLELKKFMEDSGVLIDMHGMELATMRQNKSTDKIDWKGAFARLATTTLGVGKKSGDTPDWGDVIHGALIDKHTNTKEGNRPLLIKSGEKAYGY